ncbi:unnamed protein product [Sphagnum balticum]
MMAATPSLALDLCREIEKKFSVNLVQSTKFSLINRNQCMILFRKLLDTQKTLVTIQHELSDSEFTSSQSSDVGPVIHGLIHVLKRVHAIFFKDCFCKDKWLETALRQGGDLKETFREIVSDLQWYRSVLHSIVFKQVGQDGQDLAPVDCDRNLGEIDLEALSAAAKSDQEDLKGFLRELKGEPAGCGENGGYISMQCLATQLLDKLEFKPWSSTALEKYDEGLHEGGRNKWSEWPLVLSVNMPDLRKGPLLGEGSFGSVHETDWLGETYAMKIPKHGHCTQFLELEIKALAGRLISPQHNVCTEEFIVCGDHYPNSNFSPVVWEYSDWMTDCEEEDIEPLLKKSRMWADGSDSLGTLSLRNSAMESPWMQPSQQRVDSAVALSQNELYRALAAEALEEIRTEDSKQLHHPLSSPQLHFHQQQFQAQEQQNQPSTHRMGMLGRAQSSSPINDQFFNMLPPSRSTMQNPIHGSDLMVQDWQVSTPWFSTIRTQNQGDPGQPMLPTRMGQVDTWPSPRVTGPPFTHPQHSETGVQPGLAELPPRGFRQNDRDADQLQADRSNLLFGQPLSASPPLTSTSKTKEQQNTFPGKNMLPGSFCQPATTDIASGVVGRGGLDDKGLYQQNSAAAWSIMHAAQPLRTFIKVHKLGVPRRSLDIRNFHNYVQLRRELALMFNLEGLLDETVKSGWVLECVDHQNYTLLVGDDPWE